MQEKHQLTPYIYNQSKLKKEEEEQQHDLREAEQGHEVGSRGSRHRPTPQAGVSPRWRGTAGPAPRVDK